MIATAAVVGSLIGAGAAPASANSSNNGQPVVEINPGGGLESTGSDGLHLVFNSDGEISDASQTGQDQIFYRNTYQFCCGASAPMLNIGGTLYGEAGAAENTSADSWTSLAIVSTSGSATTTGGSGTGSGTAHLRYTATQSGRDYVVDRMINYISPNGYFTDAYEITIPAGNTDAVKFYLGGDSAPGSSDVGVGVMITNPRRTVYSVNPESEIQIGFTEAPGSAPFDGAVSGQYSAPYQTVSDGLDIGYSVESAEHDAGIMIQWNLGSTPGVYNRALRQTVSPRGVGLSASFRQDQAEANDEVMLDLDLTNTGTDPGTGLNFTFDLPTGLVLGSGAAANSCNGTLTATAGAHGAELAGGDVAGATNCVVSVPVVATAAGDYTVGASSVATHSGMENLVGTSTLTVVEPSVATNCPPDHGWNVVVDQVGRLYQATLGRSGDAMGSGYWTQARLSGLSAQDLAANLLASSERAQARGTQTNAEFVDSLYQDVLDRSADSEGLAYWVTQLDNGFNRPGMVLLFSDSPENVVRTDTRSPLSDNQSMVCRLYESLFNRTPDDGGFAYWVGLLDGGLTPTQTASAMLALSESDTLAGMTDADFVDHVYLGALNRHGDDAGLAYWTSLVAGNGRAMVTVSLANTYEGVLAT
jgi:Domain of unknown function (DUF4214)